MEIIKFLEELNVLLDKSFIFRGYKFLLAFWLMVIVLAIGAILYRIGRLYWAVLISGQGHPHIRKGSFHGRWEKNELRLEKSSPNEWKVAVLEASQIFNEVLTKAGYKSETLGEKLAKMNEAQLANLEEVRSANELKNRIVKEAGLVLSQKEAREALGAFEKAMESFDAI